MDVKGHTRRTTHQTHKHDGTARRNPRPAPRRTGTRAAVIAAARQEG